MQLKSAPPLQTTLCSVPISGIPSKLSLIVSRPHLHLHVLKKSFECVNLKTRHNAPFVFTWEVIWPVDQLVCHMRTNGIPDGIRRTNGPLPCIYMDRTFIRLSHYPQRTQDIVLQHLHEEVTSTVSTLNRRRNIHYISSTITGLPAYGRVYGAGEAVQFASKLLTHNPRFYPYLSFSINTCRWTVCDTALQLPNRWHAIMPSRIPFAPGVWPRPGDQYQVMPN